MAVRHGYGKVAGTDALVFAYDTGDTVNSYKGEPTANIIADPLYALGSKNAYHDTNNTGWGTVTRGKIEEVIGPFGKPVQAYSQELISYTSGNRSMEGQPQETVSNANCVAVLTAGVTYRISVWMKATYTGTSQNRLYLSGTAAVSDGTSRQVTTEWQRFSKTYTPSTSGNYYMRHYDYSSKDTGDKIWYALPQVEVDKGHEIQFVVGTRSATQGLLDLTGNSSIDLTNAGFDSNAQLDFDGTDEEITVPDSALLDLTTEMSFEFVFNASSSQSNLYPRLIDKSSWLVHILQTAPFGYYQNVNTSAGLRQTGTVVSTIQADTWNHVISTYDGQIGNIYINGELVRTRDFGSVLPCTVNGSTVTVGGDTGASRQFNGNIAVTKVYNRALTADEVRNNYRHYKNRFGI